MEVEIERGRETETETERESRKRVRGPSSKKEDPATPAAQERLARLVAEAIETLEKRAAEAKGKPEVDYYALHSSQFPDAWNNLWSDYFGSFEDTITSPDDTAQQCGSLFMSN